MDPESSTLSKFPSTAYADLDDAKLAVLLKESDPQAATELWERYSVRIRAMLLRTIGPVHEVEDLLQEVFVQCIQSIHRLKDPGALRGFLYSIAAHRARNELRRRTRRRRVEVTTDNYVEPSQGAKQGTHHALERLRMILEELSPELRLAFVLRHVEQLELTEVADAMSWSLSTTKRRLDRARALVVTRAQRDPWLSDHLSGGGP